MQKSFSKQFCKENNHIYLFLLIPCVLLAWPGPSVKQVVGAVQQCSHNCTVAVMLGNPDQANGHMSAPSLLHLDHSFRRPTAMAIPRLSWLGCGDIFQKSSGRIFVSIGLPQSHKIVTSSAYRPQAPDVLRLSPAHAEI